MAKTYYIVTFGCQANESDSERIAGWYERRGWKPAKKRELADEVVFNTCSVRQSAEDRVIGQVYDLACTKIFKPLNSIKLLNFKKNKLRGKPRIILTGCMTRLGEKYLRQKMPGIDAIWSISKFGLDLPSVRREKDRALVPIMTGCDNWCTYCVVPYARGREVSRPPEEILCEVEALVKRGYKKIMLLGQNVNSYQKSSKLIVKSEKLQLKINSLQEKYKNNFAVLLALLNDLPGLKKIEFMTSNPQDLSDGIIEALKLPKVDRYLHLPVQSGDDTILKKMNRRYTAKQYLALITKIRQAVPEITIGTDIIVGFPGETKKQFEHTVQLCRTAVYVKAYIGKYSPRPQTAAYRWPDDVPYAEKKRRWKILDRLINHSSL